MAEQENSPAATETAVSVYVHVPFCVSKCPYCDFNSYPVDDDSHGQIDIFLEGLERELSLVPLPAKPHSIFIGGGTPTHLDAERLCRLLVILDQQLDLATHAASPEAIEVTIEANPESVTEEKARIALQAGINRISIGAQSFDAGALQFLERAHSQEQIHVAVDCFRRVGLGNISLDLMFGIPGQSTSDWERDLNSALGLQPDHLSCYNLTYEPGTRLQRDLEQGKVRPNPASVDREMFLATRELLQSRGFLAYETSNFAGRGGRCVHNEHYWLQGDYVGVGPGASDHRQGVRSTNLKPLDAWAESLARGLRPTASAETLTLRQRGAEALWLGLRRSEGVCLGEISRRLHVDMESTFSEPIERLVSEGLLKRDGSLLSPTLEGQIFGNRVGEALLTS